MVKKFIKIIINFLYKLIEFVEKIEYRKLDLCEDDIDKKILQTYNLNNLKVKSDTGLVKASNIHITQPFTHYYIELENGYNLYCADNHIIFTFDLKEIYVKDLTIGTNIFTDIGISKVLKIKKLKRKTSMCDLTIVDDSHRYYTNGILSHNTICAAITIMYYCIFENNKNVLIAANIKKTTDEIVSKIKDIYYYLPFWLKPGVSIWNKGEISFRDTKCIIKTSATTKTAAIGNTIDYLYLDEFAHVPNNISEDFYRSIYPTVAAIKNSKVVITSTPNGYNLFWRLLSGAEKEDGDPDKNTYSAMRVYWYEVSDRFVTYIKMNENLLQKYNITSQNIFNWIKEKGFEEEVLDKNKKRIKDGLKIKIDYDTGKTVIHIPNNDNYLPINIKKLLEKKESDNPLSDYFRSLSYIIDNNTEAEKHIKLLDLCEISSWREDAIKSIGSVEAFNQEYDLQFLSGSRMIFDGNTMDKIKNNICDFEYIHFEHLNKRTFIPHDDLVWIKDRPDLFQLTQLNNYHIILSIDLSEGLGGDYSVINIFRLMPKTIEEFPLNFTSLYDFFKLEQIGIYRNNNISVEELAELAYLLIFEIFDSEKLGCVLEWNTFGSDFNNSMKNLFNGRNLYSNHIYFRYKHRQDALKPQIGIKLRSNKNLFVKEYQQNIRLGNVLIHHLQTLHEMVTFIKKESATGYKYEADAGANDDITMTVLETCTIFKNYKFREMCDNIFLYLPDDIKTKMELLLNEAPNIETVDYNILFNAKRQLSTQNNNMGFGTPNNINNNPYFNNSINRNNNSNFGNNWFNNK